MIETWYPLSFVTGYKVLKIQPTKAIKSWLSFLFQGPVRAINNSNLTDMMQHDLIISHIAIYWKVTGDRAIVG